MTIQQKLHSVTTGPIIGSHKIYSAPLGRPDILVPFREVALHPTAKEPPLQLYDTSGPYTEATAKINLDSGLPKPRTPWIVARNFLGVDGRGIKPEDNGFTPEDRLVPLCSAPHKIHAARGNQTVTQYEFARAGIITEEMIYVAHRENLAFRSPTGTSAVLDVVDPHGLGENGLDGAADVVFIAGRAGEHQRVDDDIFGLDPVFFGQQLHASLRDR